MKKLTVLLLLFSVAVFAAAPKKFTNDVLQFGGGSNGSIKELIFDTGAGTNPSIRANSGDGSLLLRTNSASIGDGTASDKTWTFDIGQGANNPKFFWDNTAGALSFTNDGTLVKKIGSGSGDGSGGGVNFLANSSFEDPGTPILNWTNSGGTLTQEDLTNGREANLKFARFVATVSGQYFESDVVTVSDDVGFGCMADVLYNQGDNAFTLKVLKEDLPGNPGTFIEVASQNFSDLTSFLKLPTVTFDCEGGDVFKLRFESTGAGTLDADVAYLGSNKNITPQGKSASFVGSKEFAGGAGDQLFSGTVNAPTMNLCGTPMSYGENTDSTSQFQMVFTSLPPGRYQAVYQGPAHLQFTGNNASGQMVIRDNEGRILGRTELRFNRGGSSSVGSNVDGGKTIVADFQIDTAKTNYAISIQTETSETIRMACGASNPQRLALYSFPTSQETQEAFSPEEAEFYVEGYINSTISDLSLAAGISSPSEIEQSALVLTPTRGTPFIPCGSSEVASGTTCSVGEQLGLAFYAPVAGQYEVCYDFSYSREDNSVEFTTHYTQNSGVTDIQVGNSTANFNGAASDEIISPVKLCERFDVKSVGLATFRLKYKSSATVDGNSIYLFPGTFDKKFKVSAKLVKNDVATPRLLNQVSTRARYGSEKGVCLFANNGSNVSWDTSDPDCWFIQSTSLISVGIAELTFTEPGLKCVMSSIDTNIPTYTMRQTDGNSLGIGSFPSAIRVVSQNQTGSTQISMNFALACSKNK